MSDNKQLIATGSLVLVAIVAALVGFGIHAFFFTVADEDAGGDDATTAIAEKTLWTCSMHPQIQLLEPGQCPICNMDLIPLKVSIDDDKDVNPRQLTVSENAAKLMGIETAEVQRRFVEAEVRMVGKIDFDETRLKYITAWVPGRLERLFVDYTGVTVRKGDHLVEMYSPELLSAQEELLQSIQAARNLSASDSPIVRETTEATIKAVRDKLSLWGLTDEQIAEIEKRGEASDNIIIYAPVGGVVIHKNAQEGMYVKTGTRIYTIADLSHVWVRLDAYESDLAWLKYGQKIEFTTEAYPGQPFVGTIAYIDPVLTQTTRTVKVRVNALNLKMNLKPGMFVRAVVRAKIDADGRVMDASLAGKWICPMHPEIIADDLGECPICNMDLVPVETLGYVSVDPAKAEKPLVIPASAALVTGERAVVYVMLPDTDKPTFEGREVVLGLRAGDYYLVRSGLAEGERVVIRGNFKIDAELQIRAKPSMMMPEGGGGGGGHHHGASDDQSKAPEATPDAFRLQFASVVEGYLALQQGLAADDAIAASAAAKRSIDALGAVDMKLLSGDAHMAWMKASEQLGLGLAETAEAGDIKAAREQFAAISKAMADTVVQFGAPSETLYQFKCPMAMDNRGAVWLQSDDSTRNPYFGTAMLQCGEVQHVMNPAKAEGSDDE